MTTIFQGGDLIFYKNNDGNIMSGGYDVESHMLRNGISPMRTLNLEQFEQHCHTPSHVKNVSGNLIFKNNTYIHWMS